MDAEELFRFDLNGFLLIRGVLGQDEVAALLATQRRQKQSPARQIWFNNAANRTSLPSSFVVRESEQRENADGVTLADLAELREAKQAGATDLCPLHWGRCFRDLIAQPRVWPILQQLCGERLRLDHVNVRARAAIATGSSCKFESS
jgi:hypothetical protein